ncbi:hypothetical protein JKP88DRAFT_243246 [Tribonema minus]|uniref:Uncharacterized protein n=1 Tax=Tribonema minus TaxID=303371 RepID=A0A836CNE0_9STRA|nr:hypothetical protein JKP88DRAFT_243246 [Tribonema minus]
MSDKVVLRALPTPKSHGPLVIRYGTRLSLEERRRWREKVGYCRVALPKASFAPVFAALRRISAGAVAHVRDEADQNFYATTAAWGTRATAALFATEDGTSLNKQADVRRALKGRLALGTAVFTMSLAAESEDDVQAAVAGDSNSAQMQVVINLHYFQCRSTLSSEEFKALDRRGSARQEPCEAA